MGKNKCLFVLFCILNVKMHKTGSIVLLLSSFAPTLSFLMPPALEYRVVCRAYSEMQAEAKEVCSLVLTYNFQQKLGQHTIYVFLLQQGFSLSNSPFHKIDRLFFLLKRSLLFWVPETMVLRVEILL